MTVQFSRESCATSARHLVIRTDASSTIGFGHAMRMLALVQSWCRLENHTATLLTSAMPGPLVDRWRDERVSVVEIGAKSGTLCDARSTAGHCFDLRASWLVMDGYQFGLEYQREVHGKGWKTLVVDDHCHLDGYWADMLSNQNTSQFLAQYSNKAPRAILLLGPNYALLRREFWAWCSWNRQCPPTATKVLVTFGGSRCVDDVVRVVDLLQRHRSEGTKICVIAGSVETASYVERRCCQLGNQLEVVAVADDMPSWYAWADVAVSAAGSTCWELAFFGLPALTFVIADNQLEIAQDLARRGIIENLGRMADFDDDLVGNRFGELVADMNRRVEMGRRGRLLVDGCGAERVTRAMGELV